MIFVFHPRAEKINRFCFDAGRRLQAEAAPATARRSGRVVLTWRAGKVFEAGNSLLASLIGGLANGLLSRRNNHRLKLCESLDFKICRAR
ncbi:hypothetical protein [Mycoplana dimorpha]|uniref:hypothetical protein n=1 Tax=Mycoplana dimorpha TaxID=28320 RepID=UPI0011B2741A|nr:hypothetical protein [Mycoplana dimorpha]